MILGNPGAGKTTTMLDLAQDLVMRSQQDCDYPIPLLLNLSKSSIPPQIWENTNSCN
jgi:predicted NACHT family NTPase